MGFLRMRLKTGVCLARSLSREIKRKLATGRKPRTQKEAMHRYFRKLPQPRSQVTGLSITSQIRCCCCSFAKSCLTLCDPMDYSPSNSSVHGISQARILDWVAIFSSKGSSQPRDQTQVSCLASGFFTTELPMKPHQPDIRE